MRYTRIGISCIWVKKKVMKICFRSRGVEWYSRTSQKSSIPNETRNQRGFAVVSVSEDHNVVTTSKNGTNQRSKEKKIKSTPKTTRRIPFSWETIDSQHRESQSSPRKKSSQPKRKGARLGISRFRFLSLSWFQEIMIHRVLCITCQNS